MARGKSRDNNRTRNSFSSQRLRPNTYPHSRSKILSPSFFHKLQTARQLGEQNYFRTKYYPARPVVKPVTRFQRIARAAVKAESKLRQWKRSRTLLLNPWMSIDPRNLIRINPERRLVHCIRRAIRKQVLHATNKTGAGKDKQKTPVWNLMSHFSCKRS